MSVTSVILIAIGGALALEGAAWAIFPGGLRRVYRDMMGQMDDRMLHISGLISVFIGMICLMLGVGLVS